MDLSIKEYVPVGFAPANVWGMLGIPSRGVELQKWVHQGLPLVFYKRLAFILDVPESWLRQYLCIAPATFSRRVLAGRLNTIESDRLCSLVGALDAAYAFFSNDLEMAREWMRSPAIALDSRTPLEMMRSRVEAQAVIDLIGRLENGVCV